MSIFIESLKCENNVNTLGVDRLCPQFSWVLSSDKNGAYQTAYRIEIFNEDKDKVYDTGKIESDKQFGITLDLKKVIKPYSRYDFSVCIWDENGESAEKSSYFVTGVFKAGQWKADWFKIWYNFGKVGYVRKEFDVKQEEIEYA